MAGAESSIRVYIYGFPGSRILENMKNYFNEKPEVNVTLCDLNNSRYLSEFLDIIDLLMREGINVLPPYFCAPCALKHGLNWRDIYVEYSSPLLLLFQGGRLKAIVISAFDQTLFDRILNQPEDTAILSLRNESSIIKLNEDVRTQIENLFREKGKPHKNIFQVLPLIIIAACTDAINPCELFVLIVFLSLVIMKLGKRAVLKFGIAFSLAIFIAYFLMGLGVWRLIGYIREARIFIVILGLSLGLRSILNFTLGFFGFSVGLREAIGGLLNKRFKRIPKFLSEKVTQRLRGFSDRPFSAFLAGVAISIFLLPCTSGPYLIALSLIAEMETQMWGLLLLTLYNGIVIAPFIAITLSIYLLKIKTSELKKWGSNEQRWLNLAGGLTVMALSVYLIFYTL
ncbi:MAG: hypothetical protein N3E47_01225 [Candidatus Bathyarchaeota archaeon]|nr:hypothetical protein [Candidatus Bathyarchaeota archaeon]